MAVVVTFYVLVVIELSSRGVYFAGATPNPNTEWMMQIARNLTDPVDGFVSNKRFIIIDRDRKYCDAFQALDNRLIDLSAAFDDSERSRQ